MNATGRNAFRDPALAGEEPRNLALRSQLMIGIREFVTASRLTQTEIAARLGVTQPRLNALLKGRIEQFSLDALVNVATRAGLRVHLAVGNAPVRKAAVPDRTGPGEGAADRRSVTHPASTSALTAADLVAIPLFASLSPAELQEAARLFTVRSYPKNAVVATEGDRLDVFNIILSGTIQYFCRDEAGHLLKLSVEGPGGHFADATLGGEPILVSVLAVEDLRVASMPMTEFKRLLPRYPQLAVALLMDVVARLRRSVQFTKSFTMEGVYARLVKLLLARAVQTDGKLVADVTHTEIGHRVGATREMVGRVLRDLARGGYIKAERGRITVLRKPPRRW